MGSKPTASPSFPLNLYRIYAKHAIEIILSHDLLARAHKLVTLVSCLNSTYDFAADLALTFIFALAQRDLHSRGMIIVPESGHVKVIREECWVNVSKLVGTTVGANLQVPNHDVNGKLLGSCSVS
ncbi:hypothetical protein VNO77_30623 [Canavalia gladiata]|uniref:Uncharacterized protein n=1 Tax=Canavalia gladiata TaxID=3824 RepID=A0AAN9KNA2_CANGL